jgi:hypothetical protein
LHHVDAIVDDEGDRGVSAHLCDLASLDEDVLNPAVFLTELDRVGPAPDGEPSQFGVRVLLLKVEISQDVEASDVGFGNAGFSVRGRLLHDEGSWWCRTFILLHI